ncbi:hypothetical protein [Luteimonas cucumeris]|uniref:hypothetical protein n=1 Tax=Luteimonas cucumeris TaxID=985012 RepID=UPI0011A4A5BC|nr:hypothetical protein [Luteimonas cucumeris]
MAKKAPTLARHVPAAPRIVPTQALCALKPSHESASRGAFFVSAGTSRAGAGANRANASTESGSNGAFRAKPGAQSAGDGTGRADHPA